MAGTSFLSFFGGFFWWHFRFAIPSLVRGGGGDIPRLTLAFVPEADIVKKLPFISESEKDDPGDDDIEVTFENIESYLGAPAP